MKTEKSIKFLAVLVVFVMCGSIWAVEPNDPNLIGWWELDEGSGGTAYDSAGDNDGTIYGAQWTGGRVGYALDFDGDGDYVDATDFTLGEKVTVTMWVNPSSTADGQCFIGKHTADGDNIFLIGFWSGGYHGRVRSDTYTSGTKTVGWQHIAAVVEKASSSTSNFTFYKDGNILWSEVFNDVTGDMSGKAWTIGQEWDGSSRSDFFNGTIDDVRIYDRALSAEEIQQLCGEAFGGKAYNPNPADVAIFIDPNIVLSWSPGENAAFHDVYFGTDYNDVNDATLGSSEYEGRYDVTSWDPCGLESGTTYYWRIDEINGSHTCKGGVWSFTTRAVEGIITVGPGGPAGGYDFGTIQEGIDAAFEGEEVVVAEGTYVGIGNRNLNFGGKAITVRSTDPDDPDVVAATVIDCQRSGSRGFYFGSNEDANSVLAGLTIKNGGYSGDPPGNLQGTGILCYASPTIKNCTVRNNYSYCANGAGIYNTGNPTLINCTFSGNSASSSLMQCGSETRGGGMYNTGNPTLINCTFRGNYACARGGISNSGSPVLINCTISSNGARYAGGIGSSGNPTLINCTISNNTAWDNFGGGGMMNSSNPILFGCVFLNNKAEEGYGGGFLNINGGSPMLTNCVFSDNRASNGGGVHNGGVHNSSGTPTLTNCIVWGNTGGQIVGSGVTVSFSDVQGGYLGTENISADPLFVGGGYVQLSPGSPCIDAGNNFAVPPDTADIDGDGDTTEPIPLDIAGYARFLDDPNTADSGMGTPPIVDMGAYEYQGPLPYLEVWPGVFDFVCEGAGCDPDDQILYISNEGGGTLLWEVEEDCSWLDSVPNSGECTSETDEVVLSVDVNGLPRGAYSCQLTVSSNAINGPITVQVNLFVDTALLVPSAYPTIQAAIDAADGGDTVIVAAGTYTGDGNRDIDFKDKAITVRSADPNDPNIVAATIIDCNGSDIEQHRGFSFHSGEGLDSILAGFTITNGYADDWGSAISCRDYSSPTIRNCIITGNVNGYGGGIYCTYYAAPAISNCTISGNSAMRGGGIYCYDNSDAAISNCIITGNSSLDSGGGIYCKYSDLMIKNCTLADNQSDSQGGGITFWDSTATVTNSIIWGNTAPAAPEVAVISGSAVTVSYSNFAADLDYGGSTLNYGLGNIYVDPCFVDPCNGDYHLKSQGWRWDKNVGHGSPWKGDYLTSRCIDAGNPGSPLGDELLTIPDDPNQDWGVNLRINMGAYGGTAQASMAPYNWALLGDLSNDGTADFVDFAGQAKGWLITANEQPGDLNRDSIVGIEDLAALVEDWLLTTDWFE